MLCGLPRELHLGFSYYIIATFSWSLKINFVLSFGRCVKRFCSEFSKIDSKQNFKRHCTCIVEPSLAECISRLRHVVTPAREGRHSCRLDCKLRMFRHLCVNIERITSPVVTDLWLLVLVDNLGLLSRWYNLQKKQKPSLKVCHSFVKQQHETDNENPCQ